VSRELIEPERLLWTGQPVRGLRLRLSDVLLVPFSLVWGGFAVFWEASVIRGGGPLFFAIFGLPFVAVGLYITVGRFFYEAWRRARTHYALTSERVLIVSGGLGRTVTSLRLRTLPDLSLRESRSGLGTISFGGGSVFGGLLGGMQGWPGAGRHLGPQFDLVPAARTVYEAIRTAQTDAPSWARVSS
jgi:hypothetical protein